MRGGAHAVIGACATVPLAILFGGSVMLPICAAGGAIGALLPDIDHPHSALGRFVPWPVATVLAHRTDFVAHGRRWFRGHTIWHRGETHSVGAAGIAFVLALGVSRWLLRAVFSWLRHHGAPAAAEPPVFAWRLATVVACSVLAGYLSHLVADLANPSPQMLWWPFCRRMVHPRWLPTVSEASVQGRWAERGAVLAAIIGALTLWGGRPV